MEKVYSRTRGGRLRQIDGRMVQFIKEKQKLWKELKKISTASKGNYLATKKKVKHTFYTTTRDKNGHHW